ncbi:TITAN-like protein isoform X2 [Oryza brachyantha]|uniref:TITAN-like protein isoform X2 n=1 Tax=Oryza brachyantha TaxID=4533 RepID=UPI000776175B|nr:TITAN-like protein isoform X2 [Oryza brachyantha]
MPLKRGTPPAAAFEYCELCRRNHDQGRRHRYFPAHRAALAAALSRFRSKLSDLRRALRRPPSSVARSRLWCPFCSADLVDLDSRFACSNVIYHLASQDHLNGVKDFLRKHGGGMDQVDSFRISEDELAKWEKCCESSSTKPEPLTEGLIGPSLGPLEVKDIRNKSTSKHLDNFVDIPSSSNTVSNVVMPLQSPTNGAHYPNSTACHGSSSFGSTLCSSPFETFGVPITPCGLVVSHEQQSMLGSNLFHNASTKMKGAQPTILGNGPNSSISFSVHVQQRNSGGNSGLKANVHTGAPPPWLEASERDQENDSLGCYARTSSRKGKSGKLNPNRVGAAWAERRRAEMEMEKRGELVPETSDSSWLPNFGSVWQSGTRKESRKEFEKNHKSNDEKSSKLSIEIKPYISKRMVSHISHLLFYMINVSLKLLYTVIKIICLCVPLSGPLSVSVMFTAGNRKIYLLCY